MTAQDSPGASLSIARAFLLICWMFPALVSLLQPFAGSSSLFFLPTGAGVLDSSRTLLLLASSVAFLITVATRVTSRTQIASLLFLGWTVVGSLAAESPVDGLLFCFSWFAAAAAYSAARSLMPSIWQTEHRMILLHGLVAVVVLKSLYDLLADPAVAKTTGPFQLPNVYANWLLLLLPMVLSDLFGQERRRSLAALATSTIALTSLWLTMSRSSWLLTSVALSATILVLSKAPGKRIALYFSGVMVAGLSLLFLRESLDGAAVVLGLMALLALPGLLESLTVKRGYTLKLFFLIFLSATLHFTIGRLDSQKNLLSSAETRMNALVAGDNSTQTRLELWEAALSITKTYPFLGSGPGSFSEYYPQFQTNFYRYSDSPHSGLLELGSEVGIVGACLFLITLAVWWFTEFNGRGPADPLRATALLGAGLATAQAQIDVSYHYAEVWVALALVLAVAAGPCRPAAKAGPIRLAFVVLVGFCLTALAYEQRVFENTRELDSQAAVFHRTLATTKRIPGWSKPIHRSLEAGLYLLEYEPEEHDNAQLKESLFSLASNAQRWAAHSPRTYALTGKLYLLSGNPQEGERYFKRSLAIDPYNYPSAYEGLLLSAVNSGETELAARTAEKVLSLYQLDKLEFAHTGHKLSLTRQLIPLYFHLADYMNPYEQPLKLESAMRFLVKEAPGPRSFYGLGAALWAQGKQQEGRRYFEMAHHADPTFPSPP